MTNDAEIEAIAEKRNEGVVDEHLLVTHEKILYKKNMNTI